MNSLPKDKEANFITMTRPSTLSGNIEEAARNVTRRAFLGNLGASVGAMAFQTLFPVWASATEGGPIKSPMAPKIPPLPPRAKSVIYLHLAGSPSQLELFDHKPILQKYDGKTCPKEYLTGKRFAFIQGTPTMLGTHVNFQQHGECGAWISDLLPHFSEVVDDVAILRSMTTDQFNHAPAQLYLHTGTPLLGGASAGSWATYGLGTLNQDLPGFVVLVSGGKTPSAGKSIWGSGFLPTLYQGVQCRSTGDPVLYLSDPKGMDRKGRRETLDALSALNEMQAKATGDPEIQTRIAQYELAYRMQVSVPEVMDLKEESKKTLDSYGATLDRRLNQDGADPTFARNCLLARRLVEKGVRFVQLYDWGWDHHGTSPGDDVIGHLPMKCKQVDRPIKALLQDLKERGLLDETLVIWSGEFGRTPMRENRGGSYGDYIGRDHHPHCFTLWMAGGGVKGGVQFGQTDDIGYYVAKDKVEVRDLQATMLHLLGLDPWKLSFPFQGLDQRLIGPEGKARIIREILS